MNADIRSDLQILSAYIGGGKDFTEEQMEFASDFTRSSICFADAGTGKTHTLVAGLIEAQKYYKVPGNKIMAMSFTKEATAELASRYQSLCKRTMTRPTINFSTFHSMSRSILSLAYPGVHPIESYPLQDSLEFISEKLNELGVNNVDFYYAKRVLNCIEKLNSALCFHPVNVENSYEFGKLGISVDQFQKLRVKWFVHNLILKNISQGDLPLYCLYALMSKPEVSKVYKGMYQIMLVDEFQDLSLLHLKILAFVTDNLIVVGDMKQQIYAFNGACPEIVNEYMRMYPNARICMLTKSFRCKNEIAEYASKVISKNGYEQASKQFIGVGEGGGIVISPRSNFDWDEVAARIDADIREHGLQNARTTMFLFRNNASAVPIMEELYKRNVMFRSSKFTPIFELPIFKDLCTLANVAVYPNSPETVTKALRLFPEFRKLPFNAVPGPVQAMKSSHKNILEVAYRYSYESSNALLNAISLARQKIKAGKNASIVLNTLLPAWETYILNNEYWRFPKSRDFYFGLIAPICAKKTYEKMISDEYDKLNKNAKNLERGVGVRVYTMHAAKGLEADDVYILDADDDIFPNAKVYSEKMRHDYILDAVKDVRAERNLLYVAITRAKTNCYITYSDSPSCLLSDPEDNRFTAYDDMYNSLYNANLNDAEEFYKLFKVGEYGQD